MNWVLNGLQRIWPKYSVDVSVLHPATVSAAMCGVRLISDHLGIVVVSFECQQDKNTSTAADNHGQIISTFTRAHCQAATDQATKSKVAMASSKQSVSLDCNVETDNLCFFLWW